MRSPTTEVDRLFHALADTTRRDILHRCVGGEPSVSRLADGLPDELRGRAEARRGARARRPRDQGAPRARAARPHRRARRSAARGGSLDELEAAWRGRVERMADLLAETECRRMSVVSVEKDVENLRLVLVAEFAAPIERVWQLWADPRQLERWWGPPSHPATVERARPRRRRRGHLLHDRPGRRDGPAAGGA